MKIIRVSSEPTTSTEIGSFRNLIDYVRRAISPGILANKGTRYLLYPMLTGITLLLGALREMLIAKNFGLGPELDAFAAASCIYLFLGTQIGNGLETTFIARYSHCEPIELSRRLYSSQIGICIVLAIIFFGLLFLSNAFFNIFFGFEAEQLQLASHMVYAYIPGILFCTLISLPRAVLYIKSRYAWGFSYGAVVSCSVMATLFVAHSKLGIFSLPIGYGIGNLIMLVITSRKSQQALSLKPQKNDLTSALNATIKLFDIWKLSALVLAVEVLFQGSYITERAFAAQNGQGSLSAYFYAVSMLMIFTALIVQPVSTILFPKISRAYKADYYHAQRYVLKICCVMFLMGLIAAILMFFLSTPLVDLWLVRGKFTVADGIKTATILKILIFVLPFMSVARILKNSLYSGGNYRLPIFTNALRWGMLALLAALLTPSFGNTGLAIASIAATALDSVIMFIVFLQKGKPCANL